MSESLGTFSLLNRQADHVEDAELFCPVDSRHVVDFEQHWKPAIRQRLRDLPTGSHTANADLQDWHWDWREKSDMFTGRLDFQSFALECGGMTQGLMLCSLVQVARDPTQRNKHMVYVDYLHSAPWNRPRFTDTPRYRGVGGLLIAAAISLSREQEFGGRIGLHALPQSEAWYRNHCGMTDLGPDLSYQGLRYFEMTTAQADRFLAM